MSSINSVISNVLNAYYSSSAASTSSTSATETVESSSVAYSESSSLGRYLNSASTDRIQAKTIFEKISIDVGGGGKTISKDQLSNYVQKAEDGDISIPDEEADVLNNVLENWDEASDGSDEITYSRLVSTGYADDLLSVVKEDDDSSITSLKEDYQNSTIEAYSKIVKAAFGGIDSNSDDEDDNSTFSIVKKLLSLEESDDDSSSKALLKLLTSANLTSTFELEV